MGGCAVFASCKADASVHSLYRWHLDLLFPAILCFLLLFRFSDDLGVMAGLVMFAVGSIAVVVPTPNGAGPWHFAVITMMMLYGVGKEDAGIFALLVHGIQTFY